MSDPGPLGAVAVVGMACRYPDARSPGELWDNAVTGRRAFRRLPDERVRLADYWAADPAAEDRFYARTAAVIEGYEFDRVAHRVPGSTYRSTDLAHWLALDVAGQALADAGFPGGEGLPRQRTGVVVGNTLTGEFSRANGMRLRWPYVRRVVGAVLAGRGVAGDELGEVLAELELAYKGPFPPIDEDSLAGALSNTIAGRICNHFDLGGGGYTTDGACSSSLLSVMTAATSLVTGDLDVAVAGGVDLSIDPFELVGFAKTGALARHEMRVYDRASNGFWPGEGCGMVVLMRHEDAVAAGRRVYATIRGWGMSSDGRGGMTRPEVDGYTLALRRAYERAGVGIDTVGLFEGHGTGTAVGDATELRALSAARRAADPAAPPAAIGSIKGMIGHTKAAAGVAGLIKAVLAVHHRTLPPAVGCVEPHPDLTGDRPALRALRAAEPWPDGVAVRAGVTAMGFGGINTHLIVEQPAEARDRAPDPRTRALAGTLQDAELLLLDATDPARLRTAVEELLSLVPRLAYAELSDLAAHLQSQLRDRPYRAAVVAGTPTEAQQRLRLLRDALDDGRCTLHADHGRALLGHATRAPRVGFLLPGQGSGRGTGGGALRRRFPAAAQLFAAAALPTGGDPSATAVAQPRIVTGSLAGLRVLAGLGIEASVAVGHSLGELTALQWAGAVDEATLLRMVAVRGATMARDSVPGAMAGIAADADAVQRLAAAEPVVVAGLNGPRQTVIAGPNDAVERVCRGAERAGLVWAPLRVSHAFHSPLMAAAADAFGAWLGGVTFGPLTRRVVSTISGTLLDPGADLAALLRRQIVQPVRFAEAITAASAEADLFLEVGPGHVLTRMALDISDVPVLAIDTDDESIASLLAGVGAAWVAGAPVAHGALFAGRLTRPLPPQGRFAFFGNPCETPVDGDTLPPAPAAEASAAPATATAAAAVTDAATAATGTVSDAIELLRRLAAQRTELPPEMVSDTSRLLDDLHLSSISVGQIVGQAARELGLAGVAAPANFATATLRELAEALQERAGAGDAAPRPAAAAGVDTWVRAFGVHLEPAPAPEPLPREADGAWHVHAAPGHPVAEPLRLALQSAGVGGGVLVCLPRDCPEDAVPDLLAGVQAALRQPPGARLVVLQDGRGAAAVAKTARLEGADLRTTVVSAPPVAASIPLVVAEVAATTGFTEVLYDDAGTRRTPLLRPLPQQPAGDTPPLGPADVILVTGGGKGITAECAHALTASTGARLAILARSDPDRDPELAANLRRLRATAPDLRYVRADITDPAAVRAAVRRIRAELGPVTAVLHGAAVNEPAALATLDPDAVRRALAPKVGGLRNVLAALDALDAGGLRLLVTFGSIIGRTGLPGEAHYGLANEWLADLTAGHGAAHPGCRVVCLEWSVWSGVGMGERLSVVETLLATGVTPITTELGVELMHSVLADPGVPAAVVVAGRTGGLDTVRYGQAELPLLRFLDRPLVHYPGVELVTEAELSLRADPYLGDHRLHGDLLFPAVLGLEAMVQVGTAVIDGADLPALSHVQFARPIVVPGDGTVTIRVAALVTGPRTVRVAIRSAETDFAVDHFSATLHRWSGEVDAAGAPEAGEELPWVALDPARDLYDDGVLFQAGRFRRVRRYRRVAARHAEAEIATDAGAVWFGAFLPAQHLLGDPGARDAFMHAIQVCVPDATLLPYAVDRIQPAGPKLAAAGQVSVVATERAHDGDDYVYDVAVREPSGTIVERWDGLRLRAVRRAGAAGPWAPALLGPLLQRRLADRFGADVAVAVEPHDGDRPSSAAVLARVLGRPVRLHRRPDGRPQLAGPGQARTVSAAHTATLSLGVAAAGVLACDAETVTARDGTAWADLLGAHIPLARLLATEAAEPFDTAATRVWTAVECLQKAGRPPGSPLTLATAPAGDGWAVLASGALRIVTLATTVHGSGAPVVAAVLAEMEG
jgi:enediyne polyketide synthase